MHAGSQIDSTPRASVTENDRPLCVTEAPEGRTPLNERFAQKLDADERIAEDIRTVTAMIEIACKGTHSDRERTPLLSDAAESGVYARRPVILCEECAELARYAEARRAFCPKDPKPFCAYCDVHCYRAAERKRIIDVMRYAGRRSLFTRHWLGAIRHVLDGRKARKAHLAAGGTLPSMRSRDKTTTGTTQEKE